MARVYSRAPDDGASGDKTVVDHTCFIASDAACGTAEIVT